MAGGTPLVVERLAIGDYRNRRDNEQQGDARSHANTLYDIGWQMSISRCAMRPCDVCFGSDSPTYANDHVEPVIASVFAQPTGV